nr:hypothetical protein [Streptomyces harenosi]
MPVFGAVAGTALLTGAVLEYRAGASVLRIGAGALAVLGSGDALLRDLRRSGRSTPG